MGNGPNPHLREGALATCGVCGGTGKVGEPVKEEAKEASNDVEEKKEGDVAETSDVASESNAGVEAEVSLKVYTVVAESGVDFGAGVVNQGEEVSLNESSDEVKALLEDGSIVLK